MAIDLLIPLIGVGLAEIGDKTQLSVFLLSSRTKKHLNLLIGILLAFFIVDGIAVVLGSYVTSFIPIFYVKVFSGIIFVIFGIFMLRSAVISRDIKLNNKSRLYSKSSFFSGFVLIFLTEWGDKTQIASAAFATRYNAMMVLLGVMMALTLLSIVTIYLGKILSNKIDKRLIAKIAGIVFMVMGISFLFF
ncbi:MAG: TMEM165/GDT1 family protein [Candidatus Bathyarchaeota archaeon]|nr:TMEM165/GDT1 family protein [Candidatus Bathyarchaeota archaeon]